MRWKSIRAGLDACKVDNEILDRSRLARISNRAIQLAVIIRAVEPALLLVTTLILMSAPALAQTIFNSNDQAIGSGEAPAPREQAAPRRHQAAATGRARGVRHVAATAV